MSGPTLAFVLISFAACIFGFASFTGAQNQTQTTTDPSEGLSLSLFLCLGVLGISSVIWEHHSK